MSTEITVDREWLTELQRRLASAERVCGLVGMNATDRTSERGKALTQAWMEWSHVHGEHAVRVSDAEVATLAAHRDRRVAETMERIQRDYPEILARKAGSQESTGAAK